jgi:2,5-diketo-D-gluconate reductase B
MTTVPVSPHGVPLLGLGTWPLAAEAAQEAILMALDVGFRHIDTAQMYGNEADVGRAVAASGLKREQVFITTKVKPDNVGEAEFGESLRRSLDDLKTGYVDLLLIHWPPKQDFDGALARLTEAKEQGLARRIGVSNFNVAMLERAVTLAPVVNLQVEFHPLIDQTKIQAAAQRLGLTLSAYTPLGRGATMREPEVQAVARRLGRPGSEVVLRWIVQQGIAAIPKSAKRANAESNFRCLDFTLSDSDMAAIGGLKRHNRRLIDWPGNAPVWDS